MMSERGIWYAYYSAVSREVARDIYIPRWASCQSGVIPSLTGVRLDHLDPSGKPDVKKSRNNRVTKLFQAKPKNMSNNLAGVKFRLKF